MYSTKRKLQKELVSGKRKYNFLYFNPCGVDVGVTTGLPDFVWYKIPKREKYTKLPKHICTKLPQNIANVNKIDQMAVK
jgi:hypothetical protein